MIKVVIFKKYNSELKFVGEYLNGKKWNGKFYHNNCSNIYEIKEGKGNIKEYYDNDNDNLIFEGKYINGEKNGKGKEYNSNGKLKFRGEYLNGERNGKGKEYNFKGKLIFNGEYFYGKKWNGKGKEYTLFFVVVRLNQFR